MTRSIIIYSTQGNSEGTTINTDVDTWGKLKPILNQNNVPHDGMKVIIGETKNDLTSDDAILPKENFTLFLMPTRTKSGDHCAADAKMQGAFMSW